NRKNAIPKLPNTRKGCKKNRRTIQKRRKNGAGKNRGRKGNGTKAKAVSNAGIPVLGHIGLTPQTATLHGGYRIQGKNAHSGKRRGEDGKSREDAGACGIVREMITEEVAKVITQTVSVPTRGSGSGRYCDGHGLVLHDI